MTEASTSYELVFSETDFVVSAANQHEVGRRVATHDQSGTLGVTGSISSGRVSK